jgi:hypothetical protein
MNTHETWLRHWQKLFAIKRERKTFHPEREPLESRNQPSVAPAGSAFLAMTGQTYNGVVGSFTIGAGLTAADYQATILWGDGQSSTASIDGSGNVSGSHVFNAAGDYPVAFQVVNTTDDSTGVGVTLGLVEDLTEPTAVEAAGSFSLSETPTPTQSGSDSGGSFSLTETGALNATVIKLLYSDGSVSSTATETDTFTLHASGSDSFGSFSTGAYSVTVGTTATIVYLPEMIAGFAA